MCFSQILLQLKYSFQENKKQNSFYIHDTYYSYDDFIKSVSKIRKEVRSIPEENVALVANDDLETYSSIIALWLEGKCYVPIHPLQPIDRCVDIIEQVGMHYILDSSNESRYHGYNVIYTKSLTFRDYDISDIKECPDDKLAYILFTSGSTGRPKGVPLTRGNLASFVDAFRNMGISLNTNDRCLQMFDLTFDLSVQSYLIPLLAGACVYTISPDRIKSEAVFQLLDEQALTFGLMVPSVIHYLRPYFSEIRVDSMRYCLFCGEALSYDDVEQWSQCVPNARIDNLYGPTENTIYCTDYRFSRTDKNKQLNGILSIGKAMKNVCTIVIDDNNHIVSDGEKGELCLAGKQLTPGYWNNDKKNEESFFIHNDIRFYKTGDICSVDKDGDILYYGRKDSQVKIQGFRIELSEIECVAKRFFSEQCAVVALPIYDDRHNCTIQLVVEKDGIDKENQLEDYLKKYLPSYMIPSKTHYLTHFPLNVNNKIDRRKINTIISK
jgi:D-alanine--poly(phosphoribitol) ligase subunit 1